MTIKRNDISVDELNQNDEVLRELHARLLHVAVTKIKESTNSLPSQQAINVKPDQQNDNREPAISLKIADGVQRGHGVPEQTDKKQNEAAQSAQLILSPEKQNELLEIVKQKSDEFEKELHRLSLDKSVIDTASQQFKDELTENVSKLLQPFEQPLKIAAHGQN